MRRAGRLAALATALPAAAPGNAHRELLARLARETGAVTTPPAPSFQEYVGTVIRHAAEALLHRLRPSGMTLDAAFELLSTVAEVLAWVLIGAAVALLVRRLVLAWLQRRPAASEDGDAGLETTSQPRLGMEAWRERFRAAMEAGDLDGAMQALWMWVGLRLAGAALDPAWTSSELLRHSGRQDLRPLFARLDTWRYGPRAPEAGPLERLAAELAEVRA